MDDPNDLPHVSVDEDVARSISAANIEVTVLGGERQLREDEGCSSEVLYLRRSEQRRRAAAVLLVVVNRRGEGVREESASHGPLGTVVEEDLLGRRTSLKEVALVGLPGGGLLGVGDVVLEGRAKLLEAKSGIEGGYLNATLSEERLETLEDAESLVALREGQEIEYHKWPDMWRDRTALGKRSGLRKMSPAGGRARTWRSRNFT